MPVHLPCTQQRALAGLAVTAERPTTGGSDESNANTAFLSTVILMASPIPFCLHAPRTVLRSQARVEGWAVGSPASSASDAGVASVGYVFQEDGLRLHYIHTRH